jgi:hypothetical protein
MKYLYPQVQVGGVAQCGKIQHCTCTHTTHFGNTTGLPIPVPNHSCSHSPTPSHVVVHKLCLHSCSCPCLQLFMQSFVLTHHLHSHCHLHLPAPSHTVIHALCLHPHLWSFVQLFALVHHLCSCPCSPTVCTLICGLICALVCTHL